MARVTLGGSTSTPRWPAPSFVTAPADHPTSCPASALGLQIHSATPPRRLADASSASAPTICQFRSVPSSRAIQVLRAQVLVRTCTRPACPPSSPFQPQHPHFTSLRSFPEPSSSPPHCLPLVVAPQHTRSSARASGACISTGRLYRQDLGLEALSDPDGSSTSSTAKV